MGQAIIGDAGRSMVESELAVGDDRRGADEEQHRPADKAQRATIASDAQHCAPCAGPAPHAGFTGGMKRKAMAMRFQLLIATMAAVRLTSSSSENSARAAS